MKKLLIILTFGLMFGQTELTTRVYSTGQLSQLQEIDFDSLVGFDIGNGSLAIHNIVFDTPEPSANISFRTIAPSGEYWTIYIGIRSDGSWHPFGEMALIEGYTYAIDFAQYQVNSFELELAITAEFPIEDTGYMEEDFDFCINEGYNLVSYPCENDIAINDALPSEISNNLSSIVGEGVAGVNVNGTWVGSLTQLQAGSGYWFKSSIEACFNYECAEN